MRHEQIQRWAALLLFVGFVGLTTLSFGESKSSSQSSVIPTPTWTAAQEKAYHIRLEAYRRAGHKAPPKEIIYSCAFCGYKTHHNGLCPKCGFELTPYDPKSKTHKKVYHADSM